MDRSDAETLNHMVRPRRITWIHYLGRSLSQNQYRGVKRDFVKDSLRDYGLKNFETWKALKSYLEARRACTGALKAAETVFDDYLKRQQWADRHYEKNRQHYPS